MKKILLFLGITFVAFFVFLKQPALAANLGTCGSSGQYTCTTDGSKGVVQYSGTVPSTTCGVNATNAKAPRGQQVFCCSTGTQVYGSCGGTNVCVTSCDTSNIVDTGTAASNQCTINATKAGIAQGTPIYCVCTAKTCPHPSGTPTGATGATSIQVVLGLPGIGYSGGIPLHTTRPVTVELYGATVQAPGGPGTTPTYTTNGTLIYDNTTDNNAGYFVATVSIPSLTTGSYQILVKVPQYLYKLAVNTASTDTTTQNVFTITANKSLVLDPLTLAAGDVAVSGGQINHLNINDYNIFLGCYGSKASTSSCAVATAGPNGTNLADLNDDGQVDFVDLNIWLRSLNVLQTANAVGCDQGDCQGD